MNENNKENLLKYILGTLPNEIGTTEEIIREINTINRSDWFGFIPTYWLRFKYEGIVSVKDSELIVLYGGFIDENSNVNGIITIANKNFKPIKTFYELESGTKLRYIQCMGQNEDGTFYAVDCIDFPNNRNWEFTTSQKRFLLFNNFTQIIGDYFFRLQKSYIIPYSNFYCKQIFKNPSSSEYVMIGNYLRDQKSPDFDGVEVIQLRINVGSENEWRIQMDNGASWLLGIGYVKFDESESVVKCILTRNLTNNQSVSVWRVALGENITFALTDIFNLNYNVIIDTFNYQNQGVFINENEVYFVLNNQLWGISGKPNSKYIGLYYLNLKDNSHKTIYAKYLGEYDYANKEAIYITENNGEIYIQFNDNIDTKNYTANYYFQRLLNDNWKPISIKKNVYFGYDQQAIYVNNNYNLITAYLYLNVPRTNPIAYEIKEVYNKLNYNGESYINENFLNSKSVELFSENKLMFARNLYNKTISNNTCISTFEIPSTYLNDCIIDKKYLLSDTNNKIIENLQSFEKNIYETVYLNFINTINIINKNDVNSPVKNNSGSEYLMYSLIDKNYSMAKLYNRVILIYQDESERELVYSINNVNSKCIEFKLSLKVDKKLKEARIVSSEKEIYQAIDLSNLELNKTYNIVQKMEVF